MTNSSAWAGAVRTAQYNVHLGIWVNWSRGRIMGATLTIDRIYGNLLIAFTATFVAIVSTAFWRIACQLFHRYYSTSDPRDVLHHQRQAILRNSSSAAAGFRTLSKLAWAWRHGANNVLIRILPTLIFAALSFCAFTVAGGFSASVSSGVGNEVLLNGSQCRFVDIAGASAANASLADTYVSQVLSNAANYAQNCYSGNATGIIDCTTFVKSHIAGTIENDAYCPFHDGLCRSHNLNIRLDSGYIDSREDLGLNMPDDQRILFRNVLQCAPLNTELFSENASTESDHFTQYRYGRSLIATTNFTYEVEDLYAQYLRQTDNSLATWATDLGLSIMTAVTVDKTVSKADSTFFPMRKLRRSDANLFLIFLSGNGVRFREQTKDPWYRGHVHDGPAQHRVSGHIENDTVYRPDEAASPMGCIQQYQYCNADFKCGELASFTDAIVSAAPVFNTTPEEVWNANVSGPTFSRFTWFRRIMATSYELDSLISQFGSKSLESRGHLNEGFMGKLPDNQWQVDVTHWWAILLAAKQAAFVNAARGPTDKSILDFTTPLTDPYEKEMCNNQKILSTDFTSFSVFGLCFAYVTGAIIILVSFLIEPLFGWLCRHRQYKNYAYLEWTANGTLQLQRLAYQGLGSEVWSSYTDSIPKTHPGDSLEDLSLAYPIERSGNGQQGRTSTVPAMYSSVSQVLGADVSESNPGERRDAGPGMAK